MEQTFCLQKRKYKFFLWFHIILSSLYFIGLLMMLYADYTLSELSEKTKYESAILYSEQAKIYRRGWGFAIILFFINIILFLIIKKRLKFTKEILNVYSVVTLLLWTFNLIKELILSIQTDNFNFLRIIIITCFILIIAFYFFYLNSNKFQKEKKELDSIDCIGIHKD
ncbi:hypothetical protein PFY12_00260 [Chryseobacterium camelliae]|uniref:Uncharacterized protein n=1 Tax=Chryseobacterium camelliae TaxID=1265445 RepID=A0ABY7QNL8_9FLAO|nr:hypothetical protein [Chryseobacterium camelliae]WBV60567.1 hypothetical protein PFY12_00260 [Chryseobacterium camelliae]